MAHENLRRDDAPKVASERSFGIVFSIVFLLIGIWPAMAGVSPRWWSVAVACVLLLVALLKPGLLRSANRLWFRLGLVLGRVVSPVALGVLYFGVFVPIGLIMRLAGKDPLRLQRHSEASSYWIERRPPGPDPETLTRQF